MDKIKLQHIIIIAILLVSTSIAYYFVVALPRQNAAKLELEKQRLAIEKEKNEQELKERKSKELVEIIRESGRQQQLQDCRSQVEAEADKYLELNGTPVYGKPGVFSAPGYVHQEVSRRKQQGFDDCQRTYGVRK